MIPQLVSYPSIDFLVLPKGIHLATLREVEEVFTFSERRQYLFDGLVAGALALANAGCNNLYLNGSFVTSKNEPGDYDVAWDPEGVNLTVLDPVFFETDYPRVSQKKKYKGEYLLTDDLNVQRPTYMVEFFQKVRYSRVRKGILLINPLNEISLWSKSQ